MHQAQRRRRGRLRVLRAGFVQRLHSIANRAPNGLFRRLRGSPHARRPSHAHDSPAQRAKRAGQRVLLLRQRRTLRSCSGRRLVHVAFAVFDTVHRCVRGCLDCIRHLVWPGCETAKHRFAVRNPLLFHQFMNVKTKCFHGRDVDRAVCGFSTQTENTSAR